MTSTALFEPWQFTRGQLLPYSQTYPIPRVEFPPPASGSEADLVAHKLRFLQLETEPPRVPIFPVGTWSLQRFLDGECWLWQLREFPLRELRFVHGDPWDSSGWGWGDIKPQAVAKYVAWLEASYEPPPLEVWQMRNGSHEVRDGHNRAAALVTAGRATTLAWVSPLVPTPAGPQTLTHRLAVEAALRAGQPVPPAVLADYPDLIEAGH